MEAKQKAEELYSKYDSLLKVPFKKHLLIKQCALIAVDELIKEQTMWQNGEVNPILYWQEVKKEIKLL